MNVAAPQQTLIDYINDDTGHREKECQPYLDLVKQHLCKEQAKRVLVCGREQPNRYGYNDFCVSAVISDGGSVERKVAYVWEVKSPQCYALEYDDQKTRLRPTKDLVKAETQLFHYAHEFSDSTSFRTFFRLDAISEVIPAGIIIGRSKALVKPHRDFDPAQDLNVLYDLSMYMRQKYLYKSAGIVVKNWNWVDDLIAQSPQTIQTPQSTGP